MVLVVSSQYLVKHLLLAVEREAEVTDAAGLALLHQVVHHAILHIAFLEFRHRATYGMQQIIVYIVRLQLLQRVLVHRDTCLMALRVWMEVRQLRGDEHFLAVVSLQGDTRALLRLSLTIDGRRVEVVDAMFDGIVHLTVNHVLVEVILVLCLRRQAHHAVSQQRHLVLIIGIRAIGHLAYRWLHLLLIFIDGFRSRLRLTACHDSGSSDGTAT